MNFGGKETYFNNPEIHMNIEEDQDGSSTNKHIKIHKKKIIKRFESTRFTADMFDPDHIPSNLPSDDE
jgi:hypothetical protein